MSRRRFRWFAALVVSLSVPVSASAQGTWVETDLGTLGPGTTQVRAFAVNDNGVVAGVATLDSIPRPFVWTPESGMIDLGIGGAGTSANGVNNLGQVVGSGLGSRGFLWTPAGGMIDIGPIIPRDINDVGQVAGYFGLHAVIREADGAIIDLGTLGGTYSTAYAINNAGQVVGMSHNGSGAERAFLWTAATGMIDLGTLGGLNSEARGINDVGQVVGTSRPATGGPQAFLWTAAGGMVALPGVLATAALGINDLGRVVGRMGLAAAIWTAAGGWIEIAATTSSIAFAINNAGQAVGERQDLNRASIWSGPWQDLAIDFGAAQGIWALKSLYVWQPVHAASPDLAMPRDPPADLVGNGSMVAGDLDGNGLEDLVIDFGAAQGVWVWMNHSTWTQLHGLSPTRMVTGNLDNDAAGTDEVVLDFPGYGLWVWGNRSWSQLHGLSVTQLATGNLDGTGGEELLVNFAGAGVWVYRPTSGWTLLHGFDATRIVTADLDGNNQDEVVVNFGSAGLWAYRNNATWTPLHGLSATDLGAGDLDGNGKDELVVNFGATYGLWVFANNASWSLLNGFSPDSFVVGDLDGGGKADLAVDFNTHGVWIYQNNTTWRLLHPLNPETMTLGRLH